MRSGLLVLFVGVGFLLKFAADHSVFPLQLRLAGVGGAGLALVIVGLRLAATRRAYALALQGGGVGLIYLTLYASFALYGLLGADVAFAALSPGRCPCGLAGPPSAGASSWRWFAAIGGFSAPLLASTGTGSHVLLFAYYALLNVGVLGLALVHTWRVLNLSGFVATFAVGAMWGASVFTRLEHLATVEPFLVLFFAMYLGIAICVRRVAQPAFAGPDGQHAGFWHAVGGRSACSRNCCAGSEYGLGFSALCPRAGLRSHCLDRGTSVFDRSVARSDRRPSPRLRSVSRPWLCRCCSTPAGVVLPGALEGAALLWVGWRQNRPNCTCGGRLVAATRRARVSSSTACSARAGTRATGLGTLMLAAAGHSSAAYCVVPPAR